MKPFITISTPHRDVLEGKFTMDIFAADLWGVFKGEGLEEYKDPDIFFQKTFLTSGLNNLLEVAKKRLRGEGGDPIIQLQTPFGGGKTHALIALYHKAKEWKANVAVIDGTSLNPTEKTIWEEIEEQLTGKIEKLKGKTSPGREKIREILQGKQPLLILMDEILLYMTKASGVSVGDSKLSAQTLVFMQEITGVVKTLEKSLLVITLPSSVLEHYDENAEKMFQQLQKISGRMEKVYAPVQEDEIPQIIRRRLFSSIDEAEAKKIVEWFLDYAEKEGMFSEWKDKSIYRDKFIKSFPFQPEVIDVLYKRWGSFPTFQRTRGVIRLLALVVHSLRDSNNPFIRLCDFDLKNNEIRIELTKHIGSEYDSIIAQDITSEDSGAKKVDRSLGSSYAPFSFGTKVATTIFMYSFSGGPEKGVDLNEIKLCTADPSVPSSIIAEAVSKLKETLFYLSDTGLFFTNQPNLNKILLTKMESIDDKEVENEEKKILQSICGRENLDVYIWPKDTTDIPDKKALKLVIMKNYSKEECKRFLENCGERPRIYRNTVIFLCPLEFEKPNFRNALKKKLAWQSIEKDKTLNLRDEQKREIKKKVESEEEGIKEKVRNLYRIILIPSKENFKEIDLGIPTYGQDISLTKEVYDRLKNDGEILEKLSPLILKEKYLKGKDYVETKNILETFFKTPGEMRITKDEVLIKSINEGVKQGLFGLGRIEDGKPICTYYKEECSPEISEAEIIVSDKMWKTEVKEPTPGYTATESKQKTAGGSIQGEEIKGQKYKSIYLKINLPQGKLSEIAKIVNQVIKDKFKQVEIKFEISAKDGEIDVFDYENKVRESIEQVGAEIEKEEVK